MKPAQNAQEVNYFALLGDNFGSRLPAGYSSWRTPPLANASYHSNNITPYNRVSSDANTALTIIYAGNRLRPMTRVIRAQPGNIPLSDSDNDEPKWAVV